MIYPTLQSLLQKRLPLKSVGLVFAVFVFGIALADELSAQRVAFPTAAPSLMPTSPAPTYAPTPAPALPRFDPYGNPLLGSPPVDVPYTAPIGSVQPTLQPPGAYPTQVGAIAPVQQPGAVFPDGLGLPFGWQQGSYQYQNADGSPARMQRFLQQISYEQTWLASDHEAGSLGINRTEIAATFGIPVFYNPNTPLLITPGFAFNWLEGPVRMPNPLGGLPSRVYDAYLDTAWQPQITDWLRADLGFRTGVWTDFNEVNSDSVRFLGRGLGVLSFSPQFDLHVGVWYLDRNRIKVLPAGGFHWRPNAEWDAYVVFPNPKIRKRFTNIGSSQWWWYFAGEYGGGRWTVERDDGTGDDVDINDIRVVFGLEWETQTQARGHVEVGYVWDREVLFDKTNSPAKLNLDDTVMVRAGIDF